MTMLANMNCVKKFIVRASCHKFYSSTPDKFPYDNVICFNSNKQLGDHLCDNILYDNNDIIVVNKPYGVSFAQHGVQWKKELLNNKTNIGIIRHKVDEIRSNSDITEVDKINLYDALPYVKSRLGCDSLTVVRSPEKYTSGVCILGRSEEIKDKVKICWERSRSQKVPLEYYLTICDGIPVKRMVKNLQIGIGLDASKTGKSKRAVLRTNYSRNDVLKSRVKVAIVDSLLVSSSDCASLVQVITNQKKWHFVRLFLASYLLSPALGDHIYGSRIKRILGNPIAVDCWSSYASQPQKLDSKLLEKLDLLPGSEKFVPTMIHLSEVRLLNYFKDSDLILSAPLPVHFTWTVDKLNLRLPSDLSLGTCRSESHSEKQSSISCN